MWGRPEVFRQAPSYVYNEGQREPGEPGWTSPPTLRLDDGDKIAFSGEVKFELPIGFDIQVGTPFVIGGKISINLTLLLVGAIDLSGQLDVSGAEGPTPRKSPTATVQATPGARITASGRVGGGLGLTVTTRAEVAGNISLKPVSGKIVAVPIE